MDDRMLFYAGSIDKFKFVGTSLNRDILEYYRMVCTGIRYDGTKNDKFAGCNCSMEIHNSTAC